MNAYWLQVLLDDCEILAAAFTVCCIAVAWWGVEHGFEIFEWRATR